MARKLLESFITERDTPGLQYAIFRAGELILEFRGGMADIDAGKPMSPNTTLMAYSMTKTLTAAAVLKLVEEKRIDLEASVRAYLPEFPYGEKVLVRHLLAQSSGLPNPIPLRWVHLVSEHPGFNEKAERDRIARENPTIAFVPGEKYGYSNLSYWYLGELISRVSRKPFTEFVKTSILAPLGITNPELSFTIPNLASHSKGYLKKWSFLNLVKGFVTDRKFWVEYEDGWLEIRPHYPNGPAFGGLIGTLGGFRKFLQDQLRPNSRILCADTKALFYTQQKTRDGHPTEMTLGWHISTMGGLRYFYKEGGGAGFHSEMRIYPSEGVASVILSNSTSFNTREALSRVDALILAIK